jgi:bacteriocin-like protein
MKKNCDKESKKKDVSKKKKTPDKELSDKELERVTGGGGSVTGEFDIQKRH